MIKGREKEEISTQKPHYPLRPLLIIIIGHRHYISSKSKFPFHCLTRTLITLSFARLPDNNNNVIKKEMLLKTNSTITSLLHVYIATLLLLLLPLLPLRLLLHLPYIRQKRKKESLNFI